MLVSIIVFSFNSAAGVATSYDKTLEQAVIESFNNNFEKNTENEVLIQNIVTMAYFAKDYNQKNDLKFGDTRYILVKIDNTKLTECTNQELIEILQNKEYVFKNKDNPSEGYRTYKCKIEYDNEGRVSKVTCE